MTNETETGLDLKFIEKSLGAPGTAVIAVGESIKCLAPPVRRQHP